MRRCPVCSHPDRPAIEKMLRLGKFASVLLKDYQLSAGDVVNHLRHWRAGGEEDTSSLGHLRRQTEALLEIIGDRCPGPWRDKLVERGQKLVLLEERLETQATARQDVHQLILQSPEWQQLRGILVEAIEKFPEAADAILEALRRSEQVGGVEQRRERK